MLSAHIRFWGDMGAVGIEARDSSRARASPESGSRVESACSDPIPAPASTVAGGGIDFMAESSVSKWPSLLAVMRHAESLATERRKHLEESRSQEIHLRLPMRDVDVPLTPEGREHARLTGRRLGEFRPFDILYASPYRRTVETAEQVLGELRHRPLLVKEERLREKECGGLEGLTRQGIRARYPDEE